MKTLATVYAACPPWCAADHRTEGEHWSVPDIVPVPPVRHSVSTTYVLEAQLTHLDPCTTDRPPVLAVMAGGEGFDLDADAADQFIASLEDFLPKLRGLRAQMAAGLSD